MNPPLLIEIGCEEIPARMIAAGAADLEARLVAVLDNAGLPHGPATSWGGTRRLAVRVLNVGKGVPDAVETVLGPPAAAAFGAGGAPTPAGAGFAKKQGIDPSALTRIETEKGVYAGFTRAVPGRTLGQVLAGALPPPVAAMSFAKSMRWGDGTHRWVRPVHWVVALHGASVLDLEILGARSGRASDGHRFLAPGLVPIENADAYVEALRAVHVLVDPAERRAKLEDGLRRAAKGAGGAPVADPALLDEITNLVEWPGVVVGRFDPAFLDLPREILVTTLKHHQKSFSVEGPEGLLPAFLSVANTDRDPGGHVRRGNEWVVIGRLEDARFFWKEDRKVPLAVRVADLSKVTYHKKLGSYADKSSRNETLARSIAEHLKLGSPESERCVEAARLAKADLVTGLVGEFPELQGIVGGLLLHADGADPAVSRAVYDHYRPASAEDAIPSTEVGCVVAVADRLDTIASLLGVGEAPTGSRDPFGLRRAANGVFRIVIERRWAMAISDLVRLTHDAAGAFVFFRERLDNWLLDRGFTANELAAVQRRKVSDTAFDAWALADIVVRLEFLRSTRALTDFARLVDLTKRVDNICTQANAAILKAVDSGFEPGRFDEPEPAARELEAFHAKTAPRIRRASDAQDFTTVVSALTTYVEPIASFFEHVLVLDPKNVDATVARTALLEQVNSTLTLDFDIRELAGQADIKR
jgi:glycyl-tRNA synthetase beta chain